jgi:hypothetical protein
MGRWTALTSEVSVRVSCIGGGCIRTMPRPAVRLLPMRFVK